MDLGLGSNPNLHRARSGPFRVRIEAWQRWGGVGQSFTEDLGRSGSMMFCNRNEEMMVEKWRHKVIETKYGGAMRMLKKKRKPLTLRNEAQLNCVSLRSQLDCEVSCGAVKGQDERRPSAAPLTAPQLTPEIYAARKKTSKVSRQDRQNGGDCGSTELPVVAPQRSYRQIFRGNLAKATKN